MIVLPAHKRLKLRRADVETQAVNEWLSVRW
jgi:hypothetical protein